MAGRTRDRKELRRQADAAEAQQPEPEVVAAVPAPPKGRAKAKAPPKPRVSRARKPKIPPRLFARWGVFDGSMKRVATFEYNQRAAADQKVVDLHERKGGVYFLQLVKEPMAEPVPVAAPTA